MKEKNLPEKFDALASLVLACIHREFPNAILQIINSSEDLSTPRERNPVFFGAFDWHSAVHAHWSLVRLLRVHPSGKNAPQSFEALESGLTHEGIAGECKFIDMQPSFEVPYGRSWLLMLALELKEWGPEGEQMAEILEPLERRSDRDLRLWLSRLHLPVASGQHDQSAFSMGLWRDWAVGTGATETTSLIDQAATRLYQGAADAPIANEPSNHDFLSPSLATADLMRRVLPSADFPGWLQQFLPHLWNGSLELSPVICPDPSDGKLSHLNGLNLSRAWMLRGIASALPEGSIARIECEKSAPIHEREGEAAVDSQHYSGAHWLGSFHLYGLTGRGLESPGDGIGGKK